MILLDTNICIGFLNGNPVINKRLVQLQPSDVRLCSVVKAELYYGARASRYLAENLAVLEAFFEPLLSLDFDDRCAERYGQIRADLKRLGEPIGANDLLIAAIALANDLALATRNLKEFAKVPGLRYEAW
jgi:tRNA(fMet)-specific endonuclease VapC